MFEVAANGNKGLEPSLRDIYQMSKANHEMAVKNADAIQANNEAIASFRAVLQPELDRHVFWKSAKNMFKTSWFGKIFYNKITMALSALIVFLIIGFVHVGLGAEGTVFNAIYTWLVAYVKSLIL